MLHDVLLQSKTLRQRYIISVHAGDEGGLCLFKTGLQRFGQGTAWLSEKNKPGICFYEICKIIAAAIG